MVIVIILDHPLRGSFSDIHPLSNNAAFVAIYISNVLPPLDTSIQVFRAYLMPIILKICQLDSNSIDLLFILAYYGKKPTRVTQIMPASHLFTKNSYT